jgi:hypothetical protein
LCAALEAEASAHGIEVLTIAQELREADFRTLKKKNPGVVICDDVDEHSVGVRKLLASMRERVSWMLTSTQAFAPPIADTADDALAMLVLPSLDDRDEGDVEAMVDGLFRDYVGVRLVESMEAAALHQLRLGPWPRNGHTVAAFVRALITLLELDGTLTDGGLAGSVTAGVVRDSFLDVLRGEYRATGVDATDLAAFVVEGMTDKILLEAAASLYAAESGEDLLLGLEIVVGDGASRIPKMLQRLEAENRVAVGILDNDDTGRVYKKIIDGAGMKCLMLPLDGGPLSGERKYADEVVVEDLVETELLKRYYEMHSDRGPAFEVRSGSRVRLIPDDDDKYELAE